MKPPTFVLSVHCVNTQSGYVILGSIDHAIARPAIEDPAIAQRSVRSFRIFLRGMPTSAAGKHAAGTLAPWRADSESQQEDRQRQVIDVSQLRLMRTGPDWAIYEGRFSRPSDVATVELRMNSAVAWPRPHEQLSMADSASVPDD